ncbi:MAG: GSCFA domain-containing protein [Bacteroidaceae bacterium]|nr:GSCFA domain-containing protein [Bacteroidaceae bacterium]
MNNKSPKKTTSEPLFRTPVSVGSPCCLLDAADRSVFLGSCFAEYVGERFAESGLQSTRNPLGAAYCPASIARLLEAETAPAVQGIDGRWHTWLTDTSWSRDTEAEARDAAEEALAALHRELRQCHHLFLTFGTAHAYHWATTGEVVMNCHKHPAREFTEREWEPAEMTDQLDAVLCRLHCENPALQVVLTVSPYRYAKYGYHESQLSKARLLLMVEALCQRHPDWICYFPAYELLLDELRDYRFYADDMLHPAPQAVAYIWHRFQQEWMTDACRDYLLQAAPLLRTLRHRPSDPTNPEWSRLREETEHRLQTLRDAVAGRSDSSKPLKF